MTIVSTRMTWDQARGMSQHRARKCYERMLGLRYAQFKYSNALEYLDSLTTVVPALYDFEEDESTDQDKTMVGILMQERRPGKTMKPNSTTHDQQQQHDGYINLTIVSLYTEELQ